MNMTPIVHSSPRIERIVDLRRRIHRVVDFIDENLDAELSLDGLAEIACISPFHFHRVYSRVVGQSPADTIRRLRLLRATNEIRVRGSTVTEAALMAGYGSPQAFARAYRREFGRSPTEMRVMGLNSPTQRQEPTEFTIVDRPAVTMDAIMYEGVRSQADVLAIDAQAYLQLLGTGQQEIMSAYFDDLLTPVNQRFRCALCFSIEKKDRLPSGVELQSLHIPGGAYACVEQRGRLFDMAPHWNRFVSQVLPSFGWISRPGPVLRLLVSDRAVTPPSQRLAYLYVPVERTTSH